MRNTISVHPSRVAQLGNHLSARTFNQTFSEKSILGHLAVASTIVEEENTLFPRMSNFEDGNDMGELQIYIITGPVPTGVQI